MKTRMSYQIKMDVDTLQQMIAAVALAKENMLEGQMLTIEVSPNVDFMFSGLKPMRILTSVSTESEAREQSPSLQ
jgi:hypothetical protein